MQKIQENQSTKLIRLAFIFLFLFGTSMHANNVYAQTKKSVESKVAQAKKHFLNNEFDKSLNLSKSILELDPENYVAHRLLSEIYKENKSLDLEIFHLEKARIIVPDSTLFFSLGEAYYQKGNYSESLYFYEKYSGYRFISEKTRFLLACKIASCRFLIYGIKDFQNMEVVDPNERNSSEFEYWPTLSLDGKRLVFNEKAGDSISVISTEFANVESDSLKGGEPTKTIDDKDDELQIVFFTACNREDGIGDCDIYFSRIVNGKWTEPQNAGSVLNTEFWDATPTFSSESEYLYFSSNREGGSGAKDIWKAKLMGFTESGEANWENPENMGQTLNTSGDEISPYYYQGKRKLYFASDSHPGMGGLDLYSVDMDQSGEVKNFTNLGYPINTIENEYGANFSTIMDTAYFSVGRNSKGKNVIFSFNNMRGLRSSAVSYIKVKVTDENTNKPIVANIELLSRPASNNNRELDEVDANGEMMFCLPLNRGHILNVTKHGYLFYSEIITLSDKYSLNDPYSLNIQLKQIEVGDEIELYKIFYDVDSYAILPGSEAELQKLVSFLANNAKVKIEVQGHTDSTGNPENNLSLSNLRARSIVDYLKKNKIETARLKFVGYGDRQPIATNETETGRQLNRRTIVKIIEN